MTKTRVFQKYIDFTTILWYIINSCTAFAALHYNTRRILCWIKTYLKLISTNIFPSCVRQVLDPPLLSFTMRFPAQL